MNTTITITAGNGKPHTLVVTDAEINALSDLLAEAATAETPLVSFHGIDMPDFVAFELLCQMELVLSAANETASVIARMKEGPRYMN